MKNFWVSLEKKHKKPKYLRNIKNITFNRFKNISQKKNKADLKEIISNLYYGDVYIIQKVISQSLIKKIKKQLLIFKKKNTSSYFEMKEGCPNFWRNIDDNIGKKYSFRGSKEAWYLFRWNNAENLQFCWKELDKIWDELKYLNGYKRSAFKKNTPKNIVVDRIQFVRYPAKTGYLEAHVHTTKNIKASNSLYLSKINKDFFGGGTYFYGKNKKKINIEKYVEPGDMGLFYASLIHGVDPVQNIKSRNNEYSGRWWCGLYSPESNEKKKRNTSRAIKKI